MMPVAMIAVERYAPILRLILRLVIARSCHKAAFSGQARRFFYTPNRVVCQRDCRPKLSNSSRQYRARGEKTRRYRSMGLSTAFGPDLLTAEAWAW